MATSCSLETIVGAVAAGDVAQAVAKRLEAVLEAIWFLAALLPSTTTTSFPWACALERVPKASPMGGG